MAKRIVCTDQEPAGAGHDAAHIVAGGIGSSNGNPDNLEDVETIRRNIRNGTTYYTRYAGNRADVHPYTCSCGTKTIRTDPDSSGANNLDNLPGC